MRYARRSRRPIVLLVISLLSLLLAACGAQSSQQQAQPVPVEAENQSTARSTITATAASALNVADNPPTTQAASATPVDSTTPTVKATPIPSTNDGQVEVLATEFAFTLSQTTFAVNTPYQFVVENRGVVPHELVLLAPGEEHSHNDHGDTFAVSADELIAGALVSREQTFTEPGIFEIACKLPGHYEAGMKITITVQ